MRRWLCRRNPALLASVLASALALCAATTPADATVARAMPRDEMVQRSDLVVRAMVLDQHSQWNDDHSQIVTLTHLRVSSYLKGAGPTDLTLRQFGGTVGQLVSRVEGDAHLAPGQDVVVFLRAGSDPGLVFLTAMAQSSFLVVHSPNAQPTVQRDLHELTFATWQNGRMSLEPPPADRNETLDHLAADVARLAGGAR